MALERPRFIGSANPFVGWAEKYFAAGFNPIPLPPNQKNPPPTGWTGRGRPFVTEGQLAKWISGSDKLYAFDKRKGKVEPYNIHKANIAIRLNSVVVDGVTWDLVALDVDHHPEDSDDPKNGGPQLEYFESKFGVLPETWINSARTNGISGQRFYRAPKSLMWRGDLGPGGEDVDVLSVNYRFAACFPSTNPDANDRQYYWYPPGFPPDGDQDAIDRAKVGLIPDPKTFPVLPDSWIDFLTQGRIKDIGVAIDMDSSVRQLNRWALDNFPVAQDVCDYMRVIADQWKGKIDESAKSHNVLTAAHYHILKCGANEGHPGWLAATKEFEKHYEASVLGRNKRSRRECEAEIARSRYGALRRLKGEADELTEKGQGFFALSDPCERIKGHLDGSDSKDDEPQTDSGHKLPPKFGHGWPKSKGLDPNKYELNDDGNGEHWLDLHNGVVRYISNVHQKWMVWDGKRWHVDENETLARHLYRRVKVRQINYAKKIRSDYMAVLGTPAARELKAKAIQWEAFAKSSGMVRDIDRALQAARSVRQGISIRYEELDSDRRALGCTNGVVRVDHSGEIHLIENSKDLLITRNTGLDYIPWSKVNEVEPLGYSLFTDFLERFVSSAIDLNYFQKLCGSVLLGDSSEKMAVFFWGQTDTAKSTMTNLMVKALGEYAATRNPEFFKSQRLNPALASALSMRLVAVSEMGDNEMNSELFKNLTGGEAITCELKNSNNLVSDVPQFTIFINTNSIPRVPGEDTAFRNRLRVLEFKHQATDEEKNSGNQARMYEHSLPVVLSWLVEGASKYAQEGLHPIPVEMLMATEEFAGKLSDISEFASSAFVACDGGFVRYEDVMLRFKDWADRNNFPLRGWTARKLMNKLRNIGYKSDRKYIQSEDGAKNQVRGFINVELGTVDGQINSTN